MRFSCKSCGATFQTASGSGPKAAFACPACGGEMAASAEVVDLNADRVPTRRYDLHELRARLEVEREESARARGAPRTPEQIWFAAVQGRQVGPLTSAGLQGLRARGQLSAATLVWREGWPAWVAAEAVAELRPVLGLSEEKPGQPFPVQPAAPAPQITDPAAVAPAGLAAARQEAPEAAAQPSPAAPGQAPIAQSIPSVASLPFFVSPEPAALAASSPAALVAVASAEPAAAPSAPAEAGPFAPAAPAVEPAAAAAPIEQAEAPVSAAPSAPAEAVQPGDAKRTSPEGPSSLEPAQPISLEWLADPTDPGGPAPLHSSGRGPGGRALPSVPQEARPWNEKTVPDAPLPLFPRGDITVPDAALPVFDDPPPLPQAQGGACPPALPQAVEDVAGLSAAIASAAPSVSTAAPGPVRRPPDLRVVPAPERRPAVPLAEDDAAQGSEAPLTAAEGGAAEATAVPRRGRGKARSTPPPREPLPPKVPKVKTLDLSAPPEPAPRPSHPAAQDEWFAPVADGKEVSKRPVALAVAIVVVVLALAVLLRSR